MAGALADLRAAVVVALDDLSGDWEVHDTPVDAVTPPCYLLVWPEPWLVPRTVCAYVATLEVRCVVSRADPAPGYVDLETLVESAVPALQRAGLAFVSVGAVAPLEVGGVTYLSAPVRISHPVTFGG